MENGLGGPNKRVTLIISIIASFIGSFMMTAVPIALPTIGKEFSMEAVLLGWVVTAMNLATAAFFLMAGRLADIHGRKKVFLLGMAVFTAASFLCALAGSAGWLIAWRALQGIGAALSGSNSIAILTSVFPAEERGKALGTALASTYIGASAGPFLGGILTQQLGWRSVFWLVGLLSLMAIGLIFWKLKGEWAEARGEKFDVVGSVAFSASLVVLMYGFTMLLTAPGAALVVLGILGLVGFFWWEARVASPLLDVGVFRKNTVFVASNMATFINYSASLAAIILLTLYLQYNQGFSAQTAGMILLVHSVCMAIVAPIAGRISDRIEPQKMAAAGMAINCAVFLFFFFLTGETPLGLVMGGLTLFGVGWGLFSSPNSNAIMGSVERKYLGVASAVMGTMRSCGMMMSMGINMILFSVYIGDAEITPEYYPAFLASMKTGFIIFIVIGLGGMFAQLAGRKSRAAVR